MIRKILKYPNPILNKKSEDIVSFDEDLINLLQDMKDTCKKNNGVGLSAIQIGISKNVLIIDYKDKLIEMINPKIIEKSELTSTNIEGCLSVPKVKAKVARSKSVKVEFQDRHGKNTTISTSTFLSTIIQHEIEHLMGGLHIDNLSSLNKKKALKKYK